MLQMKVFIQHRQQVCISANTVAPDLDDSSSCSFVEFSLLFDISRSLSFRSQCPELKHCVWQSSISKDTMIFLFK